MANINRVTKIESGKAKQPFFGAGNCKFGTMGKGMDGDLYIFTTECKAVNLRSGDKFNGDLASIVPLEPNSTVEFIVNMEI